MQTRTNLILAALVACGLAACGKETPAPTPIPTPKTGFSTLARSVNHRGARLTCSLFRCSQAA